MDKINRLTRKNKLNDSFNIELLPKSNIFFSDKKRSIYLLEGNSLEIMDNLAILYPAGCFDMIFADPPYFLSNGGITCHAGKMVKVHKGDWDKSKGADINHEFNTVWLSRCQKLLRENGTIWVSGTHHVIFSIGFAMQQLGMKILNGITWEKPNPPPNLSCRYFTHSTETIIWAAKDEKSKHYFNYALMKKLNNGKQMKSVWSITAPGAQEKTVGKHPTQKPIALIDRCILASTRKGDSILDPFNGSGSTGISCLGLNRKYVGIELSKKYLNLSIKRFKNAFEVRAKN